MTLILSASDFLIEAGSTTHLELTGAARLHADIDSAAKGYDSGSLPSSSYCREYATAHASPSGDIFTTVSSSVDGGAYIGPFGDNAISVRAWIRMESSPDMILFIKNTSNNSDPNGYQLTYHSSGGSKLRLEAKRVGTQTGDVNLDATSDIWHRVRLDYIPIASEKDVLNFYTSSAGGTNTETWELVDTMTILSTDNYYMTASTVGANVGYAIGNHSDTRIAWIDDFDVYVTPVG